MNEEKTIKKIKPSLTPVSELEIPINGEILTVKTMINMVNKNEIIKSYFSVALDDDAVNNYIISRYSFILSILAIMTNLDVDNIDINAVIDSGLWGKISNSIVNLPEVIEDIKNIEDEIKEQQSLNNKMSMLVEKISNFISSLSNVDLSNENIQKVIEELGVAKKELSEYFPPEKEKDIEKKKKKHSSQKKNDGVL